MNLFSRKWVLFTVVGLIITVIINLQLQLTSAEIGISYGLFGNNLPTPRDVINMYKEKKIPLLRLFDPNHEVLDSLRTSGIRVSLGVNNPDIFDIAMNINTAKNWVNTNVLPYVKEVDIEWITLGNEMVPTVRHAELIPQAMKNIQSALNYVNLTNIKISTVVDSGVLRVSYPPSVGQFSEASSEIMKNVTTWLASTNNPLLINAHPYFAYIYNLGVVPLDYCLFDAKEPIKDGEFKYYNMFEAMIDAFIAALGRNGGENVKIVVSETGWPTAGNEPHTSITNAQVYNQRLIDKFKQNGTPRRPSEKLDIFIFSMFNENQKPEGTEQHWGIYYPDKTPVYPLNF